jgi:hypothetical protein
VHDRVYFLSTAVPERLVGVQANLSQHGNSEACNARPVADDTCLIFPGHSKLDWTSTVNAWTSGGMIGSLCCGHFSDVWGTRCCSSTASS